jgi:hypothetical protein
MKNNVEQNFLSQLDAVFAQLTPHAVEEFYAAYQQWSLQQHIRALQQRIDTVRAQQAENELRVQQTRPSAIALAALARLQSNGVSDIELLDALLERGEAWLDQTMQRLDYFEQFDDFIADDYTQWCQGALEGAFDWIDSLRDSPKSEQEAPLALEAPSEEVPSNSEDDEDVEALLLQRLAIEDKEDDLSWQDAITLKRTVIKLPAEETATAAPAEEQEQAASEEATPPEAALQAIEYIPQDESVAGDEIPIDASAGSPGGAEEQIIPEAALPVEAIAEDEAEQPALVEFPPAEESPGEEGIHTGDEQTALVEFAAPSEVSPAEEAIDQVSEQITSPEIAIPDDISAPEDTARSEVNEPGEIKNNISEEITQHEHEAIATGKPVTPVRSTPPKRGLIRLLIWIFTGK